MKASYYHLGILLALMLLGVLAYGNSLNNGFVWDDTPQIVQNPLLQPGQGWLRLFSSGVWAFAKDYRMANNYYRPMPMLMYRGIAQVWGFDAHAFHLVSLIFHVLMTLVAYAVFYRLTRGFVPAFAAAALFAAHPIHTEAVDWISCLSELGCAVFFALAFLCYLFVADAFASGSEAGNKRALAIRAWWIASLACFACALLWKEMAMTLPLVVAAHFVFFSSHSDSASVRTRKAFRVLLPYAGVFFGYLVLRHHALGMLYAAQRNWVLSPLQYLLSDIRLVSEYWLNLILPVPLNAYHVFTPVNSLFSPSVIASVAFLLAAIAAIAYGYRRAAMSAFAATWVFLTLLPVLNLRELGRNAMAERYLYIPSIGFCLLLVLIGGRLLELLPPRYRISAGSFVLILVLGLCTAETAMRSDDWKDNFAFFSRAVEESPAAAQMHLQLAVILRNEKNDQAGAEQHYLAAISLAEQEIPPERQQISLAYGALALIYGEEGQFGKALKALDGVKAADPKDPDVDTERGVILAEAGQWREAEKTFKEVLIAQPNNVNAFAGLGNIALNDQHDDDMAIGYFQRALRIHSQADTFGGSLHDSLGAALCESVRCAEGIPELRRAIEISPNEPLYHVNLGKALGLTGHLDQARKEFEKALSIAPGYPPARESLLELDARELPKR